MIVKIKGVVSKVLERKSGVGSSGKSWASQEFVITEQNERQTPICIEVFGEDTLSQLNLQMNANVEISCAIESREWNGKYYTKLRALPPQNNTQTAKATTVAVNTPYIPSSTTQTQSPEKDDLPF